MKTLFKRREVHRSHIISAEMSKPSMEFSKKSPMSMADDKAFDPKGSSQCSPENAPSVSRGDLEDATAIPDDFVTNRWQREANKLIGFVGAEARGIERVDDVFRMGRIALKDYFSMTIVWFSVNLTVSCLKLDNLPCFHNLTCF